jgi:hypothetical protein
MLATTKLQAKADAKQSGGPPHGTMNPCKLSRDRLAATLPSG